MELSCTLAPSEGECTGDEVRWKQLVMNLVSNAIKFTAGGRVDVRLSKSDGVFTLSVADTGCGIPDHYQKKLFSAFSQADFGYARTHGGSGLGLFISSLIVKAGKGSIHVKENAPQGTIFTVTLPCKPPPVRAVLPPEVSPPRLGEYHVLLVEDNVVNQRVITKMLATFNITPDLATNGIEGLDMARKKQYDMVLMDCQMPQMDGFTATQHIRELPEYQRTPIVALTALAIPGDRERCLGAGMNDVLTKPFTRVQLSTLLERFLFKATARGSSS